MADRKNSIKALIAKAEGSILKIEKEYNESLKQKTVNPNLKIEIKNYCENLRSTLDYLAREIVDAYCPNANPKNRLYFPILPNLNAFQNKMKQSYPNLQTNCKDIYDYLLSIQPFQKDDNKWLHFFNKLNNENKHENLVEQTKSETKRINVKMQNGSSVDWDPSGTQFQSGVFIGDVPVNPQTQMPYPHQSQEVKIITWVDFKFSGIDVSALWLLKKALNGIKNIHTTINEKLS